MTIKSQHVLDSLRKQMHWPQPSVHHEILAGFKKDGLVDDSDAMHANAAPDYLFAGTKRNAIPLLTPLQANAADANNDVLLRQIFGMCRRFGYDLKPNEIVNTAELDRALAKYPNEIPNRMALKTTMARLHLIP